MRVEAMRAAVAVQAKVRAIADARGRANEPEPRPVTLMELIRAINEVTDDDRETVATVLHLLRTRQVRLCGILRDTPIDDLS